MLGAIKAVIVVFFVCKTSMFNFLNGPTNNT